MDPLIIGGLGKIVGGIFGARSERKRQARAEAFERQRIQMTAADARAAGIHPLAAIGAASGYTNPYTTGSTSGSSVGDAIAAAADVPRQVADRRGDAELRAAQLDVLKSEAERNRMESRATLLDATSRTAIASATARARLGTVGAAIPDPSRMTPLSDYPGKVDVAGRPVDISNPGLNDRLQDHYGEGADWITLPFLLRDMALGFGSAVADQWEMSNARAGMKHRRPKPRKQRSSNDAGPQVETWNAH